MTKVSIIVPVYNVKLYVEECLESLINQTYKNIEIILIDDGSTDGSGAICDNYSYKDERVIVIHKANGGLSSARNAGIEAASGKYLIFVDSDDYWIGEKSLQNILKVAEDFDADIVRGEYVSVNDKGEKIRTITKDKIGVDLKLLDSASFYVNAIAGENFSVLFLFRKDAIGALRFNEKLKIQEDIDFNIKFFSSEHKCVYTKEVFYVYRKRANSITTFPKIYHLIDSFYICDVFENLSQLSEIPAIKAEYQRQSVLKYLRAVSPMAEEPYYSNLRRIKQEIGLRSIYLKAVTRAIKYRIFNRKTALLLLPPMIYIRILHLKIVLYNLFVK